MAIGRWKFAKEMETAKLQGGDLRQGSRYGSEAAVARLGDEIGDFLETEFNRKSGRMPVVVLILEEARAVSSAQLKRSRGRGTRV